MSLWKLVKNIVEITMEPGKPREEKHIHSHHIFMFPFQIENKGEKQLESPNMDAVLEAVKKNWQYSAYDPVKSPTCYSEYNYFYEHVRKTVMETRMIEEVDAGKPSNIIAYPFIKPAGKKAKITFNIVIERKDKNKKIKKFTLKVQGISLKIFETGIGILILELVNYSYPDLDSVLLINDFGRRTYPQFLAEHDGIETIKESFLPDKIDFQCDGIRSSETLSFNKYYKKEVRVADYIEKLIGREFLRRFEMVPVIDDRMYTVCWYGNNELSRKLNAKLPEKDELTYESSDEWYKFIFLDGKSMGCGGERMKRELIHDCTYHRWVDWGTFFGITRYSLMSITGSEGFPYNVVRVHMNHQYYQIAVILLAQRASILKFSAQVARISGAIGDLENLEQESPEYMQKAEKITASVKKLQAAYIRFINRLWFTEVTPQEQGIEMYSMAVKAMGIEKQITELKDEIKALYDFVDMTFERIKTEQDRKINQKLNNLNVFATIILPLTALTGFLGMNLYFVTNVFQPQLTEEAETAAFSIAQWLRHAGISFAVFIAFLFSTYGATKNMLSIIKDYKEEDILKFLDRIYLKEIFLKANVIVPVIFIFIIVILNQLAF